MRSLAFLAACLLVPALHAQTPNASGGPLRSEQAAFDVTYYDLDLRIDPAGRAIDGTLTMTAGVVVPTAHLLLDLDAPLAVHAVRVEQEGSEGLEPASFERGELTLRVALGRTAQPGETVRVAVAYGGSPRVAPNPPWVGGFSWEETADGRPWVAVSCQGEGADVWWPTKDHPSDEPDSMRIALTVPSGLKAISNGRFEGAEAASDGWTTWRWFVSTPINNYGVSFGVAPYAEVEQVYESPLGYTMPVTFYVLPEREADARRSLPGFLDQIAFLETTLGPYPFRRDGYKILHTPYLGMEHQSLIAYGDDFSENDFGFDWLHFHEFAHEWFANLVTAPDWGDMWVHEGFAVYLEALYAESLAERNGEDGLAAYHAYLNQRRAQINNRRPVAPGVPTNSHGVYFGDDARSDGDIYVKGAWILNTLRYTLGDDAFFDGLRRITYPGGIEAVTRDQGCGCHFVSTEGVQHAFEEASGRDLDAFFRVYLRQPDVPRLVIDHPERRLRWSIPGGVLAEGQAFEVPVPVVWGPEVRIEMTGGEGELPEPRSLPRIDPDGWLLMEREER